VKCTPRAFFTRDKLGITTDKLGTAAGEDFASTLWSAAASLDLLEAAPQAYLTGKMLMDLGVKPGKQMGEIIKESFELQLDGEIKNADEAVAWARKNV
jgi:tRNA nucleotidyltransferase (CCA-adding enzyme)